MAWHVVAVDAYQDDRWLLANEQGRAAIADARRGWLTPFPPQMTVAAVGGHNIWRKPAADDREAFQAARRLLRVRDEDEVMGR